MAEVNFDDISLGADIDSLGEDLDNLDLGSFGEVETEIQEPHIKMSTKSFLNILKLAKQVSTSSGRDIVTKSVLFAVDGDHVVARATDLDTYLEYRVECLNTENVLSQTFSVPLDILLKVAKALPSNTSFIQRDGKFYIHLFGGDLLLETYNVAPEKFIYSDATVKVNTIPAQTLYSVIKDFTPLVTAAINPNEKRIIFDETTANSSYMWAITQSKGSWGNFDLRLKDINVLKTALLDLDEEVTLSITEEGVSVKRAVIEGSRFKYAFFVSETAIPKTLVGMLDGLNDFSGIHVDLVQLYKLIEVASELPYSVGKVGLKLTDDGVDLSIKTKKDDDSKFTITGSLNRKGKTHSEEIVVQAKLLRILLRTFSSESSVQLVFSPGGLGVTSDSYRSALFLES